MKGKAGKTLSLVLMIGVVAAVSAAAPSGARAAPRSQAQPPGAGQHSNQSSDITITCNNRRVVVKD